MPTAQATQMRRIDLAALARQKCADGTARELRQRRRVLAVEVASFVERSQSTVSMWERGERTPMGEAAVRYGQLLQHWLDSETSAVAS